MHAPGIDPETAAYGFSAIATLLVSISGNAHSKTWIYSAMSAGLLSIFWSANNCLWIIYGTKGFIISDPIFAYVAWRLFPFRQFWWCAAVTILYWACVPVDVLRLLKVITYTEMANIENSFFAIQLVAASYPGWSRWFRRKKVDTTVRSAILVSNDNGAFDARPTPPARDRQRPDQLLRWA